MGEATISACTPAAAVARHYGAMSSVATAVRAHARRHRSHGVGAAQCYCACHLGDVSRPAAARRCSVYDIGCTPVQWLDAHFQDTMAETHCIVRLGGWPGSRVCSLDVAHIAGRSTSRAAAFRDLIVFGIRGAGLSPAAASLAIHVDSPSQSP